MSCELCGQEKVEKQQGNTIALSVIDEVNVTEMDVVHLKLIDDTLGKAYRQHFKELFLSNDGDH